MIVAYRILRSKSSPDDQRVRLWLSLSQDALLEPGAPVVVFDTDDIPGWTGKDTFEFCFPKEEIERPRVQVNGVEMFLTQFSSHCIMKYQDVDDSDLAQFAGAVWVHGGDGAVKNALGKWATTHMVANTGEKEVMMVVAWE